MDSDADNDALREENTALRRQLEQLLREARANEEKMRRFERLEHRLIGARSFIELLELLLGDYKQEFGLEALGLTLVDRDGEAATVLAEVMREDGLLQSLSLAPEATELEVLHGESRRPWLGSFDLQAHGHLFGPRAGFIATVALLPLRRQEQLIGSLNFGSSDSKRYESGTATDLLERLAGIVGVCLDNALNQERLKMAGLTDALTGVHNRRYFDHRCQIEVAHARRHKHTLACMFLDLDGFKRINDTYGHQLGDEVLRAVGSTIQHCLRTGDTIARFGGEEFIALLPQTSRSHVREIAERIREAVAARPLAAGVSATISIGLAMLPGDADQRGVAELATELITQADHALYQAKRQGRNQVVCA
ncbi:MAG: sensor domain-containing diguanylate cyclase [Paucibacter sp.]|nr:sensor domain-containing diguanylate cyclase [Roseateles sp.]